MCLRQTATAKNNNSMALVYFIFTTFLKKHTIIQSLNIRSLSLDFENIETNHNLQTFHILCLNEIRVIMQHYTSHPYANHPKYTSIEVYGSQGPMLLYDKTITLDSNESITSFRAKFIVATFNKNIFHVIHIIIVYKPPSLSLTTFLFKNLYQILSPFVPQSF
jgi:hypothetical protein